MALEVELKFIGLNYEDMKIALNNVSAEFLTAHFEKNIVLDDAGRTLYKRSALLRLRESEKKILTVKRIPSLLPEQGRAKIYEEYESEVSDIDEMLSCFRILGYEPVFRYEKFREKWRHCDCVICVDILPFGFFVEIEGEEQNIINCAAALDIDINCSSKKTYHELNREYRRLKGLKEDENFVFTDEQRAYLPQSN